MRKPRKGDRRRPREAHRINQRIRIPEIRVIGPDGDQLGVMETRDALALAQEKGLDLVEIAPTSRPPVCRIMDYGKFKYEQAKKKKQAKKSQSVIELKEIKFRPKIEQHDIDFKTRHLRRFLEEGNKCRLMVQFRGREAEHPHLGQAVLERVVETLSDIAQVEVKPSMEGRRMFMTIGPKPGYKPKAKKSDDVPSTKTEQEAENSATTS